jgi:hypothetical protein
VVVKLIISNLKNNSNLIGIVTALPDQTILVAKSHILAPAFIFSGLDRNPRR